MRLATLLVFITGLGMSYSARSKGYSTKSKTPHKVYDRPDNPPPGHGYSEGDSTSHIVQQKDPPSNYLDSEIFYDDGQWDWLLKDTHIPPGPSTVWYPPVTIQKPGVNTNPQPPYHYLQPIPNELSPQFGVPSMTNSPSFGSQFGPSSSKSPMTKPQTPVAKNQRKKLKSSEPENPNPRTHPPVDNSQQQAHPPHLAANVDISQPIMPEIPSRIHTALVSLFKLHGASAD
ncbi:hypothetical protein BJ085DRAFT_29333 [Dimargaris cristalligena]|uniref:Uncharacterized protein n=1 Tax=Dimargaris cristalligena TaxID=215637 RepID=A0A4P9ZY65_9FUNG|nr:hypothetical protein BJ085DRAFT_29333 [Dimargaris cristalligena]|eukprot:RKP38623.1 hypothetical protein BJ085DRAFT_29333 [Dimargaris cristalligena]